jgi:hypothetical protein
MKDKLAIVGCAHNTRNNVNYDDSNLDIWVFNETAQKEWCKRSDLVIQIHDRASWMNPLNQNGKDHGKWLMSGDTPIIYMFEKYSEVPRSVKYPMQEIMDKLLPNFIVDSERGRKDFFTSSAAYAFALAIYFNYKEIHTYGIEMTDDVEYQEQQPCSMFWTGIAIGRGIKWVSHSHMFDVPLYPSETIIGLDKEMFRDKIKLLESQHNNLKEKYLEVKNKTNQVIKQFENSEMFRSEMMQLMRKSAETGQEFGKLDGAKKENEKFYERAMAMEETSRTYVFYKNEFVRDKDIAIAGQQKMLDDVNISGIKLQKVIDKIKPNLQDSEKNEYFRELKNNLENYIKFSMALGMYSGMIEEDDRFIEMI